MTLNIFYFFVSFFQVSFAQLPAGQPINVYYSVPYTHKYVEYVKTTPMPILVNTYFFKHNCNPVSGVRELIDKNVISFCLKVIANYRYLCVCVTYTLEGVTPLL